MLLIESWANIIQLQAFYTDVTKSKNIIYLRILQGMRSDSFIAKYVIPGLIKMSAFDWSMTHWYKAHATGW